MKLTPTQAIYLAGLLHDIGKFGQRAAESINDLTVATRNLSDHLQPTDPKTGRAGYQHVLWTSEFWEIAPVPKTVEIDGKDYSISQIAAKHHRPLADLAGDGNVLERIIAFADRLSSGQDRKDDLEIRDDESLTKSEERDGFKKRRLRSIFDAVFHYDKDVEKRESAWHTLSILGNTDDVFARVGKNWEYADAQKSDYKTLWESFITECNEVLKPIQNAESYLTTLYALLKKYTWAIPSSTWNDRCDISLFDHSRTVGAIAACLYESQKLQAKLPITTDGLYLDEENRFSLLTGDLSGIQKFIYQINAKNAAKTLKGRSFFIQLFTESVVQQILKIYGLADGHVLFSSGGRFQLIVPNNAEKYEQLIEQVDRINAQLLADYDGALYVAVGQKPFKAATFRQQGTNNYTIAEAAQDAQRDLEKEKRQKYKRLINPAFFATEPIDSVETKVCMATGIDLPDNAKSTNDEEDGEIFLHDSVKLQQKLGRNLRNAAYLLEYSQKPYVAKTIAVVEPTVGGYYYVVLEDDDITSFLSNQKDGLRRVISLNNTSFAEADDPMKLASVGYGFMWYGGAWNPKDLDGEAAEFPEIAEDGSMNQLGILRMDVDNLGDSFRTGFNDPNGDVTTKLGSISRIATLSSMLDWFFSGYMNQLVENEIENFITKNERFQSGDFGNAPMEFGKAKNHIYPVYAGGDDLFIVARWDVAIELANAIKTQFAKFTNSNPKLTISGGVATVGPRFPIHKAAQMAASAEHSAKYLKGKDGGEKGKNAFCLFDTPISWADWDKVVRPFIKDMIELQEQMGSRSLTSLFRQISAEYYGDSLARKGRLEGDNFGPWRWRTAYKVKRLISQYKKKSNFVEGTLEELGGLGRALFNGSYKSQKPERTPQKHLIDFIPLASRWIQNITRTTKKTNQSIEEVDR